MELCDGMTVQKLRRGHEKVRDGGVRKKGNTKSGLLECISFSET